MRRSRLLSRPRRSPPDEARSTDRTLPRDTPRRCRRLVCRQRLREPRDRLLAADHRSHPSLCGHVPYRCREPWPGRGQRDRPSGPGHRSHDLRPGLLSQPAASRSGPSRDGHRAPQAGHRGGPEDGRRAGQHVHGRRRQQDRGRQLGRGPQGLAGHRPIRPGPRRPADHRELPHDLLRRRVAGRPQHRLEPAHLAAHPGAVVGHHRAQLRPVAPGLADDRPGALHPRVRAAHPPCPGQGPDDRPQRALRPGHALRWHRLAGTPHPRPGRGRLAGLLSALYRAGYDGDIIIEHEDRVFEGTDDLVKRGFLVARDTLRPYIK